MRDRNATLVADGTMSLMRLSPDPFPSFEGDTDVKQRQTTI